MSIGSVDRKNQFITYFQNANDIAKELRRSEIESRKFAKQVKKFFKKNDDEETCEFVWRFLRVYIRYKAEPPERQTGKTIPRFFVDKTGDCKHYSIASVGILNACGIPAWFSVVRQSETDKTRFHAYCSALIGNKVVIVDPCRTKFDSECYFVKKYNFSPIKK